MLGFAVTMNGLEEIDWEKVVGFAKRFGGILLAVLFALAARRKKKAAAEEESEPEPEPAAEAPPIESRPIEPGDDVAKMASRYSNEGSSRW